MGRGGNRLAARNLRRILHPDASRSAADRLKESLAKRRRRRRDAAAAAGTTTAADRLDGEIHHLIHQELPERLDSAVRTSERELAESNLLSRSQGWSILYASWLDIWEDVLAHNRTFDNVAGTVTNDDGTVVAVAEDIVPFVYESGFLGFYGAGFGLPLILGLPEEDLHCGAEDFHHLIQSYGLEYGPGPFLSSPLATSSSSSLASRLGEFELLSATQLDCVLSREGENLESAEAAWALEELNVAMNLRLQLEERNHLRR